MNYEINKSKYVTLVGDVQSGKTIHEINYCYESVFIHKEIFCLRFGMPKEKIIYH